MVSCFLIFIYFLTGTAICQNQSEKIREPTLEANEKLEVVLNSTVLINQTSSEDLSKETLASSNFESAVALNSTELPFEVQDFNGTSIPTIEVVNASSLNNATYSNQTTIEIEKSSINESTDDTNSTLIIQNVIANEETNIATNETVQETLNQTTVESTVIPTENNSTVYNSTIDSITNESINTTSILEEANVIDEQASQIVPSDISNQTSLNVTFNSKESEVRSKAPTSNSTKKDTQKNKSNPNSVKSNSATKQGPSKPISSQSNISSILSSSINANTENSIKNKTSESNDVKPPKPEIKTASKSMFISSANIFRDSHPEMRIKNKMIVEQLNTLKDNILDKEENPNISDYEQINNYQERKSDSKDEELFENQLAQFEPTDILTPVFLTNHVSFALIFV